MWNMMCDVMPTIVEDSISQRSSQFSGEEANFEQLMVSMLDERDKLVDSLRETRQHLQDAETRLQELERERDALNRQLNANIPQVGLGCVDSGHFIIFWVGFENDLALKKFCGKCHRLEDGTMSLREEREMTQCQYFSAWVGFCYSKSFYCVLDSI